MSEVIEEPDVDQATAPVSNSPVDERRIGLFAINRSLIADAPFEELLKFFANFLIVRAEAIYWTNTIQYVAYSPVFEPVDPSKDPPLYMINMDSELNVSATLLG